MKLTKRMLSLLLTVVMVLSMVPAVFATETEAAWTPNPTQTYTADEWFEVGTAEELQSLMSNKLLNDPECLNVEANEGKTFGIRLTADIATNTTKAPNHYAVLYAGHYVEATDTEPAYGFAVNYVIDLNGHTITDTSYNYRMIGVYGGSDIVLTNGTVRAEGKYVSTGGVFFTQDNTNLTFDGVQIIANSGCKNEATINGNIANFRDKLLVKNSRIEVYETVYTSGTEINRAQYGGMFWVAGATATVTLENSEFVGGYAGDGGMFQVGYTTNFTATDCTFTGGTATNNAGCINSTATNGSIKLTRCTFTGGEAGGLGGQIRMGAGAPLTATDCTFTGGTAVSGGGNIVIGNANSKSTTPVHNFIRCTISDGTATNGSGGNINIKNSASTHRPETVTFKDCTISGGKAQGSEKFGGNIYGCSLASTQSGVTYYPVVTFDGGSVSGGQAVYGGNFGSANHNRWVFTGGVEVSGGIATKKGGNLYTGNKNTVTTIYDATFTGGEAGTSGGNVQPNAGKFYMYGGTITGGTAPSGKVFYATSSTLAAEIYGGTLSHTSSSSCYSGSSYIKIFNATTIGFSMTSCVVEGHSSYTKLEGTPTTYIYTHDDLDGAENNTAATCTTDGQIKVECADCDMTFTYVGAPATGHTAGTPVVENEVANSCTADGSYDTVVYCETCNAQISRETNTVPATGHTAGTPVVENEVANSCTADGSYDTVVYCTVCNAQISRETNTVPATGHTAGTPVVENEVANSCTADGSYDTVVYCSVCNAQISRETTTVPAAGHTEVTDKAVAPDCTNTGLTEGKHCSVCGAVTVAQKEVPALGHTNGEAVTEKEVASTCTADGSYDTVTYCTVCGVETSRVTTTVAALGHSYTGVKTEATYEADAYTTHTCDRCGDSYVETHAGTKLERIAPNAIITEEEKKLLKAGEYMVWPSGDDSVNRPLEIVVNFKAEDTLEDCIAGGYANWLVDFNLTFTGMETGSIPTEGSYLAGNYGSFGWVVIPATALLSSLEEGVTYPIMSAYDADLNYKDICKSVQNFTAAIHIDQAVLDANPNLQVKLELVMTNPENSDEKLYVGEGVVYTAAELGNMEVPKPQATVTELEKVTLEENEYRVWNGMSRNENVNVTESQALVPGVGKLPLEVVVNFQAQDTLEECLAGGYAKWLVDFNITVDGLENGSFVADNCYLAGNYGSFGWIKIPLDGQTIQEGVTYPVVALYDNTLNYKDICKSVKDFTAAIHIDQAILDANPDLTVTLQLIMTNPNNANDTLQIGEDLVYGFNKLMNNVVAQIKETGANFASVNAAIAAAENNQTIVLVQSTEEEGVLVNKGLTLDLNGLNLTVGESGFVVMQNCHVIDSTDGKGMLIVERDAVVIYTSNAQLPVWDETGYRFVKVSLRQSAKINEEGNGYFRFYIEGNDANCALQQALSNGGTDNGVYVKVKLSWTTVNGTTAEKTYIYSDEHLAAYAENWTGNEFRLTVTGMEKVTELNMTAVVTYKMVETEEDTVILSGDTKTINN